MANVHQEQAGQPVQVGAALDVGQGRAMPGSENSQPSLRVLVPLQVVGVRPQVLDGALLRLVAHGNGVIAGNHAVLLVSRRLCRPSHRSTAGTRPVTKAVSTLFVMRYMS